MTKFFSSITFKIWLPFTLALIIIISISAWYYPSKQKDYVLKNKKEQVSELAVGLAHNYESAQSNYTDYTQVLMRVKDIIDFVKKDNKIDFIEITENSQLQHRYVRDTSNKVVDDIASRFLYGEAKFKNKKQRMTSLFSVWRNLLIREQKT